MKKITGILIVTILILIGGFIMFQSGFGSKPLKDSNGKFRKDITLKQLQMQKAEHGPLTEASCMHGGGMEGGTDSILLSRDENGAPLIMTRSSPNHYLPLIVKTYTAEESLFVSLRDLIDRYNLSVWGDLPFNDEMIALDAPSTLIQMTFDDSDLSGNKHAYISISYDNVIPEGGREVLNQFAAVLRSGADPDHLKEEFFEDHGERIVLSAASSNTEAEINAICSGVWHSIDQGREFRLYSDGLSSSLDLSCQEKEPTGSVILEQPEIIMTPYLDADCGWHVLLQDSSGSPWVLYAEGTRLHFVKQDGSEQIVMERYG